MSERSARFRSGDTHCPLLAEQGHVGTGHAVKPEQALAFLERHQPMPPDEQLTEELIREYDEAWRALKDSDNPRVAGLMLNSFGEGDGWGVYQLVDEALRSLPRDSVVDALDRSLTSPFRSVSSLVDGHGPGLPRFRYQDDAIVEERLTDATHTDAVVRSYGPGLSFEVDRYTDNAAARLGRSRSSRTSISRI